MFFVRVFQLSGRGERGMATAEYCTGLLGVCLVAGVLVNIGGSDWFQNLLNDIVKVALDPQRLIDHMRNTGLIPWPRFLR